MDELKVVLTQTGFNLERLKEDKKIDQKAYDVLKNRNELALSLCVVGVPKGTLLNCPKCKDYYGIDINHCCFKCKTKIT